MLITFALITIVSLALLSCRAVDCPTAITAGRRYLPCDVAALYGEDALRAISDPGILNATVATDVGRWVEFTRIIVNGRIRYIATDRGPIVSAIVRPAAFAS